MRERVSRVKPGGVMRLCVCVCVFVEEVMQMRDCKTRAAEWKREKECVKLRMRQRNERMDRTQ